jgi:single-strand DNA-binding protein
MDKAEHKQEQKKPRIVIKGEVTNHPVKRHVGKTGMVADLTVAAKEVTIDGVALSGKQLEAQKWFKVPVWGGKAESASSALRAGTEITVEGKFENRDWKTTSGENRSEQVVHDAKVQVDKESTRGYLVVLEGKVGRDPVLEVTPNGRAFTRMKLEQVVGTEGPNPPEKVSVLGWEGQAREMEDTFRQGDTLRVKGELVVRPWETKDGEKRTFFEVQRPKIELLEKTKDRGIGAGNVEAGFESKPDKREAAKGQSREEPKQEPSFLRKVLTQLGGKPKQQEPERSR